MSPLPPYQSYRISLYTASGSKNVAQYNPLRYSEYRSGEIWVTVACRRFSLKYEGLPYTTVWVEYPDIEALCKKIGANATSHDADGNPHFTLPVIHDISTNVVISDSIEIAGYLDQTYPSTPRLFPVGSHALQYAFQDAFGNILRAVSPVILFERCSVLNPLGQQREAHWKKIREEFGKVDGWFAKNDHGDFIMGDVISYADITISAWILWIQRIFGVGSKEVMDIEEWHEGRWATLVANFRDFEGAVA